MNETRIHRVDSADGTQIAARVYGQGAPLVFLPAGPGDSETSWGILLPFVSGQFTCYLMNTRGRGLSADHPDHSPPRLVEDVMALVQSIGGPVGLVEWGTALWARVAAENTDAVAAVAAYEPAADQVVSEEAGARIGAVFTRVAELAAGGRVVEAARYFIDNGAVLYTDEDLAGGAPWEFWKAAAPNIPVFLEEGQQTGASEQPSATDPALLAGIAMPVLLLYGSNTDSRFVDSVRHVAGHVAKPHVAEIPGAGHFGPYTEPEAVAAELIQFFANVRQPARQRA
jgi:pimeloyl-ACP methyl ester carboxylesterase